MSITERMKKYAEEQERTRILLKTLGVADEHIGHEQMLTDLQSAVRALEVAAEALVYVECNYEGMNKAAIVSESLQTINQTLGKAGV